MKLAGKLFTVCAAGLALAACSKEDDAPVGREIAYSGPTAAIVISDANAASLASSGKDTAQGMADGAGGAPSLAAAASADGRIGYRTALAALRDARRGFGTTLAAVGYVAGYQSCPGGGGVSVQAFTASDTVATTGDYIQVSYNVCDDGQGTLIHGTLRMEVTASDALGDPSLGPTSMTPGQTYAFKLTVTNFSIESGGSWGGIEGDMEFSQTWYGGTTNRLESSISGTKLVSVSGQGDTVLAASKISGVTDGAGYAIVGVEDYDADATATTLFATEYGVTAKTCSIEMGGCLNIEMSPAFRQLVADLFPASGTLKLSDDVGHYIQLVALGGDAVNVSWDVILDDGITPDVDANTTWTCLGTSGCFAP